MIIVSALDNSGQLYSADLVRELKHFVSGEEFVGIGGRELAEAGCNLVYDISSSSAMLGGVIKATRWAVPAYRKLTSIMRTEDVKLVILVDSPTFNLPLAKSAKKRGIKTLYYIAPQTWAWARFRTKKIKKRVDKLAVILPFEEEFFRTYGIDVEFVGHPFVEKIMQETIDTSLFDRIKSEFTYPRILLLPGSRKHVVEELLSEQLKVVEVLKEQYPDLTTLVAAWKGSLDSVIDILKKHNLPFTIDRLDPKSITVLSENRPTLIKSSDLVLSASGTGALEVAYHQKPMIIMYNASKWGYLLVGRWLISTKYLSLINILAQKELIPEFMPYIKNISDISETAISLLRDEERTQQIATEAYKLIQTLYKPNPAKTVARLAYNLMSADSSFE